MPPTAQVIPVAVFGAPVHHVADPDEDVAEQALLRVCAERLHVCVARLPLREREVVCRRYGLGRRDTETFRAIAQELEVTVWSVWASEQRALELLRESF